MLKRWRMEAAKQTIGDRIREQRKARKLTQSGLGDLLEWTPARISNYENNIRQPKPSDIAKLAKALNVSQAYLAFGDDARERLVSAVSQFAESPEAKALPLKASLSPEEFARLTAIYEHVDALRARHGDAVSVEFAARVVAYFFSQSLADGRVDLAQIDLLFR